MHTEQIGGNTCASMAVIAEGISSLTSTVVASNSIITYLITVINYRTFINIYNAQNRQMHHARADYLDKYDY